MIFCEVNMKEKHQELIKDNFYNAVINHEKPICPKCGKGRIICPSGQIEKPHCFICTNECGWIMNIDYTDLIIE